MNIGTERRGLGRGLGELFQRTEPQPGGGQPVGHLEAAPLAPVPARFLLRRSSLGLDLAQSSAAANRLRRGGDE